MGATTMTLRFRRLGLLALVVLAAAFAAPSCESRYPINVCSCSRIHKSNSYDISLVLKASSMVTLAPAVDVVQTIGDDAVIMSNLKSAEVIKQPYGRASVYWEDRGCLTDEGYYLHHCSRGPYLIPLGMNRDQAIAKATELIRRETKQVTDEERGNREANPRPRVPKS